MRSLNAVYIHYPFCLYKCHYCDFNSYAKDPGQVSQVGSAYIQTLLSEIDSRQNYLQGQTLDSIFFGGGTPSLMAPSELESILNHLQKYASFDSAIEITLEANPKTIDELKLKSFKHAGVNRVSLGVQSFHDAYLAEFGRIHTADEARETIAAIQRADFPSWNLDFIFGFPGQTLEEWRQNLEEVITINPPHVSCYALTEEEGTIYSAQVKSGKYSPPEDDVQTQMFLETQTRMTQAGYQAYEVSNFAKPNHQSRHNRHYWQYDSYLGLGAGAVSFVQRLSDDEFGQRWTNEKNPQQYVKERSLPAGRQGQLPVDKVEKISIDVALREFLMMGLRLEEGVSLMRVKNLFGVDLVSEFEVVIDSQTKRGFLVLSEDQLTLTAEGRLWMNQVVGEFL